LENKAIPHIDQHGNIIIPFNADQKYQYRNGGRQLSMTLMELNAPKEIRTRYVKKPYPGDAARAGEAA